MRFVDVVFLVGSVVIFSASSFFLIKIANQKFSSKNDSLSEEVLKRSFKFSICVALVGAVLMSGLFLFLGIYNFIFD